MCQKKKTILFVSKQMDSLVKILEFVSRFILPEYNGHYANSTFTTRQNEAKEITDYLQ